MNAMLLTGAYWLLTSTATSGRGSLSRERQCPDQPQFCQEVILDAPLAALGNVAPIRRRRLAP
jgi:hypothetical protein